MLQILWRGQKFWKTVLSSLLQKPAYQISHRPVLEARCPVRIIKENCPRNIFIGKFNTTNILARSNILEKDLKFSASETGLSNITQAGSRSTLTCTNYKRKLPKKYFYW